MSFIKKLISKFIFIDRFNLLINKDKQCIYCNYLNDHHKSLDCPGINMAGLRKMAELYKSAYESAINRDKVKTEHLTELCKHWRSKYEVVAHENNKLRKKNEHLKDEIAGIVLPRDTCGEINCGKNG